MGNFKGVNHQTWYLISKLWTASFIVNLEMQYLARVQYSIISLIPNAVIPKES